MAASLGSPLSQFVILAQSAQGRACEALVRDALDHSGVFVFGELLDCPNVQALAGSEEGVRLLELLRIFAYGTYQEYVARRAQLPELTAAQCRKLQLLTIVSMASQERVIKFPDLQVALEVGSVREVEDIVIEAVYQNLIAGRMDQEKQCVEIESFTSRDVRDEDVDFIISTLGAWEDSATKMVQSLDGMAQHTQAASEQHRAEREELEKLVQKTREGLKEGGAEKAGGDGGCTRMSADYADEEFKRAKSTRGRWMGSMGSSSRGSRH